MRGRVLLTWLMSITMGAPAAAQVPSQLMGFVDEPQAETTPLSTSINTAELDRRALRLINHREMTGMAMAIVEGGEITFAKGYGVRQSGARPPVTEDTVFRWASVSKGVAAATLLGLVEDNQVDPTAPIEELAPSLDLPPSEVAHNVVDLLSHRIGLSRNAYDNWIEGGKPAKATRAKLSELGYICPPATCHTYQNVAFDAAAEIVEQKTGLPYKSVVQRDLFNPLGMETASLTLNGLTSSQNWARPHGRYGQPIARVKPTYYRVPAAAGVNSSVKDLARWMIALMPGTDEALPDDRLAAMQAAIVRTPREQRFLNRHFHALQKSHYGLGLRVYDYEGHKVVGHRGGVEGYRALILFDPEKQAGIALMWNSPHSRPIGLQLEFLDQLYGLPKRDWLRLDSDY